VNAVIAGFVVAVIALTLAFTVVLAFWWVRDRRRRRARDEQRRARQDNHERAVRRVRLRV